MLTKSEITRHLGISRTSVTKYCKEYEKEKNYSDNLYPEEIIDFIKQKQIESVQKKAQNLISFKQKLLSVIDEQKKEIEELKMKIRELESKIEELSKNEPKNEQNDLTESFITQVSNVSNSLTHPKIILKKNTNKPNIELIRIVKQALDEGNHNWKQIAEQYGVNRDTVEKYALRIKKGLYDKYLN